MLNLKAQSQLPRVSCIPKPAASRRLIPSAAAAHRKPPKNLRHPRRAKLPPDPDKGILRFPIQQHPNSTKAIENNNKDRNENEIDSSDWSAEELDAISALFDRRMPQKPITTITSAATKQKPIHLPLPFKLRHSAVPTPKHHIRSAARSSLSFKSPVDAGAHKNPEFLIKLAHEIADLPADSDASQVLDEMSQFLRKGSLSLTIRELGHMGLPDRALQTLLWAQNRSPKFFPDDRVLAAAVEVLARHGRLKIEGEMERYINSASRIVVEAMAKGFIISGNLHRARKILLLAKDNKRTLNPSVHVKLIAEAGKTPDGYKLALALLEELGEREDFDLEPQDCTAVMKVCTKLGKYEIVESLFEWFKASGNRPSVVMYTTVIYSRYCSKNYRAGLAAVWEMEESDSLLDLPAYRVVIRLCVALNDVDRAARYFSRLKEAGFSPTYDIYRDMIRVYTASERLAKCRQICKEAEMEGWKLDRDTASLLAKLEERSVV